MIVKNVPLLTAVVLITWSTVFQECYTQTTVVGPSDTVYVSPGDSASFNCSVTWDTSGGVQSIQWGRSRDDGSNWNNVAICYDVDGSCTIVDNYKTVYSYESSGQNNDFFKLTVDSATLDEDAHYDCWPASATGPTAPHARLYVLYQVNDVSISGYNNGDTRIVDADTEVITTCTAESGNPPADLLWTIGDKDIKYVIDNTTTETGDDTRLYDTTSNLKYAFNASDDQQYLKCQSFQHDSLTPRSVQILMDVKHAPVIHAIGVESWEGNTVTVECGATANPDDITYSWESDDGQTGGDSRTWTLTDQDGDDEVTVTCNASNTKGETSLTEIVKKPYVPTVMTTTDNPYTANEGDKVELSCKTDAEPPFPDGIIWEWLEQGQDGFVPVNTSSDIYEITPESGDEKETTLTISSVQIIHANTYVCKLGESAVNISVIVTAAVVGTSGCDTGCIIGISVGCSVVVLLVVILVLWWWLRRRNDDKEDDYTKTASSNHRPTTRDAPADVEMTTASGMTTAAPPSDDVDSSKYSDRGYDDRYDDRYANNPRHRYDEPPEDYRYNEPPIDEGDGYPNYSNPSSPNYDSYDRRQQSPQLHYADLDLNPQGQNYQPPPREHTEYTTITPTIV